MFYLSIGLQPKQCEKCEFYLGRGRFHNLLAMGQPNGLLHSKKETIKIFMLWDASQPIKLIYMNHNNYLSLSHTLVKNMWLDQYANHSICSATIIVGFEV